MLSFDVLVVVVVPLFAGEIIIIVVGWFCCFVWPCRHESERIMNMRYETIARKRKRVAREQLYQLTCAVARAHTHTETNI